MLWKETAKGFASLSLLSSSLLWHPFRIDDAALSAVLCIYNLSNWHTLPAWFASVVNFIFPGISIFAAITCITFRIVDLTKG